MYGEGILRQTSKKVDNIDGELVELLDSTLLTMRQGKGLGLAANQVGVNKRFFAIDLSYFDVIKEPIVIINPEIVEVSGSVTSEEGCLSFPGLFLELEKPEKATVAGLNRDGKEITLEGNGLMARVLVHEVDHLDGKLFIDNLSKLKLGLIKNKLKKIRNGERL